MHELPLGVCWCDQDGSFECVFYPTSRVSLGSETWMFSSIFFHLRKLTQPWCPLVRHLNHCIHWRCQLLFVIKLPSFKDIRVLAVSNYFEPNSKWMCCGEHLGMTKCWQMLLVQFENCCLKHTKPPHTEPLNTKIHKIDKSHEVHTCKRNKHITLRLGSECAYLQRNHILLFFTGPSLQCLPCILSSSDALPRFMYDLATGKWCQKAMCDVCHFQCRSWRGNKNYSINLIDSAT